MHRDVRCAKYIHMSVHSTGLRSLFGKNFVISFFNSLYSAFFLVVLSLFLSVNEIKSATTTLRRGKLSEIVIFVFLCMNHYNLLYTQTIDS